jgi:intein/homing endonuclease
MSLNYIYEPKDDTRLPYLSLTSAEYKQMLLRNGYAWGELSAGKIFPDFIMTASDEFTKLFIRAYMDAEACFTHSKGVIEMSTASPTVAMQMFTLLKRFGIGSRIMCKRKCATNGRRIYRDYYEIHISGQALRIYRAKIGFGVDYKSDGLNDVCDNRKCNSNLEKIPMYTELCKLREATQISKSLITSKPNFYGKTNPSVMESHKIMERVDKLLVMPENQVAWRLDNRINYMTAERKKHLRTFKTFLARELSKEVCYIEIKSIECTQYSGWVYDLQVKGSTNYVAEGILCQNY